MNIERLKKLFKNYNFKYIPHNFWVKTYDNTYFNVSFENGDILNRNKLKIEYENSYDYKCIYINTFRELERFLSEHFKQEYRMLKVKSLIE